MSSFIGYIRHLYNRAKEEHAAWKENEETLDEVVCAINERNERWKNERPRLEAEAARNARIIFARNMMKLKQRKSSK